MLWDKQPTALQSRGRREHQALPGEQYGHTAQRIHVPASWTVRSLVIRTGPGRAREKCKLICGRGHEETVKETWSEQSP